MNTSFPAAFNAYLTQAATIVDGPAYVECQADVDFYGSRTLTLGLIPSQVYLVESRSVYAPIGDESQEAAVLRAVYFDRSEERKKFLANPNSYRLELSAKFVLISTSQLWNWLQQFSSIQLEIGVEQSTPVLSAIIRKLHIDWSPDVQSFGVTWLSTDLKRTALNWPWDRVWREMDELLVSAPVVRGIEERLFDGEASPSYRFEDYQPTRLTSYLDDSSKFHNL